MGTITFTTTYNDASLLSETQIDVFKTTTEEFFNVTKISNDNLQTDGVSASLKFKDGSVDTACFPSAAVTTTVIADSAATTAKIANSNIATAKIADNAITTAKIADSNVTTAKIADGAVTYAKTVLSEYNAVNTTASVGFGSPTEATVYEFTEVLTGRPYLISISTGVGLGNHRISSAAAVGNYTGTLKLYEGATLLATYVWLIPNPALGSDTLTLFPETLCFFLEAPSAGSHTYTLKLSVSDTNAIFSLPTEMVAYEL